MMLSVSSCSNNDTPSKDSVIYTNNKSELEDNVWLAIYKVNSDKDTLVVEYKDEIGLSKEVIKCKIVFESKSQYKFVAPWIDGEIVEKSNTFNLKVKHTVR